jgi:hypothetical protein
MLNMEMVGWFGSIVFLGEENVAFNKVIHVHVFFNDRGPGIASY